MSGAFHAVLDPCVDPYVDPCTDPCVDPCTDPCMDPYTDLSGDLCTDLFGDLCTDHCKSLSVGPCIGPCSVRVTLRWTTPCRLDHCSQRRPATGEMFSLINIANYYYSELLK